MQGMLGISGHNHARHGGCIIDGRSSDRECIQIFPELAIECSIGTEYKSICHPRLIPTPYLPDIVGLTSITPNGTTWKWDDKVKLVDVNKYTVLVLVYLVTKWVVTWCDKTLTVKFIIPLSGHIWDSHLLWTSIGVHMAFLSAPNYYQSTYSVPVFSELVFERIWYSHLLTPNHSYYHH